MQKPLAHTAASGDATAVRNALCPCGSGRRYKQCCGAIGSARASQASAVSTLMQQALAAQRDARFEAAKRLYQEVLALAPASVDALNMLALVEYALGDVDHALERVAAAMRLAPNLAAVRHNERIIAAAMRVRSFRPFVFDPQTDRRQDGGRNEKPLIHIFAIAGNPAGGTEWHCIELARRLARHANVTVWGNPALPEVFTREREIRVVDAARGVFPQGGTLVIAGSYLKVGSWYEKASYRRVVLLCNIVDPICSEQILGQLCQPGKPKVEMLYASDALQRLIGLPGSFEPSPIDTDVFLPRAVADDAKPEDFVVGRLSRDHPMKYHDGASEFYSTLAHEGVRVRLMGGRPLAASLADVAGVTILPQGATPAPEFLRGLDCFTYRTSPAWTEAWGRVVAEAMATALPVVVHANGGYAQLIRHGENGFLFHRDEEALQHIRALVASPALRNALGARARDTVLDACSERGFERYLDFYLR